MSALNAPHTVSVGAAWRMFTCEVYPPARLFWSRLSEGEVKGGVILPSSFRILGGAELGREEKGPRGEGTPKILRERVAGRREVAQGAGNREEGGLEFPPAAHGSGVNSLRNLTEGADWHLPPVWHSQLPPPFLGQPLILSLSGLPATLLLVTCTAPALGLDF